MADEAAPKAEGELETKSGGVRFGINAQYVKDFSFENPNAPGIFTKQNDRPDVDVDIDVGARKISDDIFEVALAVKAGAKIGEHQAFVVELVYAGVFTIQNISEDNLEPMLLIECPRLLFPFARSAVANLTREGGFPPLLINPVDFAGLYKEQKKSQAAGAKADAAAANKKEA